MREHLKTALAVLFLAVLCGILVAAFVLDPAAIAPWVLPGP
jgi:hypothetical protein